MAKETQGQRKPKSAATNTAPPTENGSVDLGTVENKTEATESAGDGLGFDVPNEDNPAETEVIQPQGDANDGPPVQRLASRQTDVGRPYCRKHNVLMVAGSTTKKATYYKCPVAGCDESETKLRPKLSAPVEPLYCRNRYCPSQPQGKSKKKPAAAEVDYSDPRGGTHLIMKCPVCGWEARVPRPDINRMISRIPRNPAPDDVKDS